MSKSTQLQIRVSPKEKARLVAAAGKAGMSVSEWVLSRALPPLGARFQELVDELAHSSPERASYALAALSDFITALPVGRLLLAVDQAPTQITSSFHRAYVAAMVEHVCARGRKRPPEWTRLVQPLTEPYFASKLVTLRAHLLRSSPPAFRRRNIFIDATVGDRV